MYKILFAIATIIVLTSCKSSKPKCDAYSHKSEAKKTAIV